MSGADDPSSERGSKARDFSTLLGLAQDFTIELGGKAEHRAHAFRLETDEQHHLAVAQLVVLGDNVKLVGIERRQAFQVARAIFEDFQIVAGKVIVFGMDLVDRGKDSADRLADGGMRDDDRQAKTRS